MKKCLVFAPIAEREVHFYLELADYAKKMNWAVEIQFISFFQAGNELISQKGFRVWDIYEWTSKTSEFQVADVDLEKYFKIDNIHKLILHEKLTFGIRDNRLLHTKYYRYLNGIDLILKKLLGEYQANEIFVFQELGGFVAPLSLMYNCKGKGIKHTFFEPSFFKGTMNFIEDSFVSSFKGLSKIEGPIESKVSDYLKEVQSQKQLVIPQKDTHHYKDMGLLKLFNANNFKKLVRKLYFKYVKGQRQEYEWILNHASRNFRQYLNRKKTDGLYSYKVPTEEFIYFPFHVQLDVQLTIRNPDFLNQLAFVEYLSQVLPKRYKLVVKEHPASIGGFDSRELKRILRSNQNLVLLYPMLNTYEILSKASAVVTINSKVGAEAAALGKRVACMGHGFYWNSELVTKFDAHTELLDWLEKVSSDEIAESKREDILRYFSEIYRQSYPFELYNHTDQNLKSFFYAIKGYVGL